MVKYYISENKLYPENNCIKMVDDDGKEYFIPMDEKNSDYQAYLLTVKE